MILQESSWSPEPRKSYPQLTENIKTDVVVVGAGINGIFSAYILSCAGLKVIVLEANEKILDNATLFTTAFITKLIDASYDEMVSIFGIKKAKLIWQSGEEAIDLIASIIKKENISCEFKFVPSFFYAKNEKQFKKLTKEYDAIKKTDFEAHIQKNGRKLGFDNSGFMKIPTQAKFHPIKFAQALADRAEERGAKIFTNTKVMSIKGTTVKTKDNQIQTKNILIATDYPFINEGTRFKKAKYLSYVYELEIPKKIIAEGLYIDMNNPYHYFRIDSYEKFDRMIIGGEDHRADFKINPQKNFKALLKHTKIILGNNEYKIKRKWYGQVLESVDRLPYIGSIKSHIFVSTVFSGNGMTYSAISSLIIRDLILNNNNPYIDLYDVKRTPTLKQLFVSGSSYISELFGGFLKNFFS